MMTRTPRWSQRCLASASKKEHNSKERFYPGTASPFTTSLGFEQVTRVIPTYRVMDESGLIIDSSHDPQLDKDTVIKMYKTMLTLSVMDTVLYDVQRQGRISFYMTNTGEEASHIGSAAALHAEDIIYGQYREAGVFMWRGFSLDDFMNQCYSNEKDYGKGRQMPVHYGSKKLNYQTISSPLGTQIPQAAGAGYAQKLMGQKNCTVCYFGEGAASEGDFHAALNFAATLECPTIFFCRNNQWAISTPSKEQYRGDGIASRGAGYGIDTVRVDGNDIFAVYNVTKMARANAVEKQRPVLIEAMSYRVGHHSTSDDSSRYRDMEEVDTWKKAHNPITRLRHYLIAKGWWSEDADPDFIKHTRQQVLEALKKAEALKKPSVSEMFTDVYDVVPPHLAEQKRELEEHLKKYPQLYPTEQHA